MACHLHTHSSGSRKLAHIGGNPRVSLVPSAWYAVAPCRPVCRLPVASIPTRAAKLVARQPLHVVCSRRRDRDYYSSSGSDYGRGGRGQSGFSRRVREFQEASGQLSPTQLMLGVGGLVAMAALLGPFIVGVAFSAIAMGAALSVGAMMFSVFFPFMLMAGLGMFMFGGVFFAPMLGLGMLAVIPKLISMVVTVAGIGIGWAAVSMLTSQKPQQQQQPPTLQNQVNLEELKRQREVDSLQREVEQQAFSSSKELKDFDMLLAEREAQKRMDRWKQ